MSSPFKRLFNCSAILPWRLLNFFNQALVVETLNSAIYRIKIYPVDNGIVFPNEYPLDSAIQRLNNQSQKACTPSLPGAFQVACLSTLDSYHISCYHHLPVGYAQYRSWCHSAIPRMYFALYSKRLSFICITDNILITGRAI